MVHCSRPLKDGNEQAVNCLLAKLEAATPLTVKSAVYAVRPLVHDGDASVIAWVQSNLQHDNWDIRSAAEDLTHSSDAINRKVSWRMLQANTYSKSWTFQSG
eukprot:966948-Amphidinium_carterae.2